MSPSKLSMPRDAQDKMLHLRFKGISAPVALAGAADLLPAIETAFRAWPWRRLHQRSSIAPNITITKKKRGYLRVSPWVDSPEIDDDPADAMCDFVSDILDSYIEEHPGVLGIHAAAVRIGSGLVIFPSTHRAGKSLLATHLIRHGGVLFSDDVLLLAARGRHALATGISPRLRLPLPKTVKPAFRRFLKTAGMCTNHRYGWVHLKRKHIAPFGTPALVKAIVVLDRHGKKPKPTRLVPIPRAEGLKRLADRGFALDVPASTALSRLTQLTTQSLCYRLRYRNPDKAATCLIDAFT